MFQTFFGAPRDGRLGRLPFLGHYLALLILGMAGMMIVTTLAGITVHSLQQWTHNLAALNGAGLAGVAALLILMPALVWAQLNLTAKRLRDIGLPGWKTLALLILVLMLVDGLMPSRLSGALDLLVMISLLVVPGGAFVKVRRDTPPPVAHPKMPKASREGDATPD